MSSMVLILDGNSEKGERSRSNLCYLTSLRHSMRLKVVTNLNSFFFSGANQSDDNKLILKKETQGVPQMKEKVVSFDADKLNHPSKAKEELADIDMDPDAIVGDEDEIGMIVNFNNESLKLENYDGIGRKHRG